MKKLRFNMYRYLIAGGLLLFLPGTLLAAELYIETIPTVPREGEELIATLFVDTAGKTINAVEGSISFSSNLKPIQVYYGSSFIPLWLKAPKISGDSIAYAGVIPGGFKGSLSSQWKGYRPGKLFTVVFVARETGPAWLQVNRETTVLLHDGNATEDTVIVRDSDLEVRESADHDDAESSSTPLQWDDSEPPEPFEPVVVQYPNKRFGGVWQLVFVTQDARSGVAYYEVKEGDRPFVRAESPYRLKDQGRNVDIVVRAVDQAGNMREVVVPNENESAWYDNMWLREMLLVILVAIITVQLMKHRRRRNAKK